MSEFFEASINFSNADVWKMYAVMTVVFFGIALILFKASLKDD
ncbi:MAG: hypothetical protein Q9M20_03495 [Mariprofundaceae bacterium]|nr:hypothetical protein [Mariprofundaceae bacterium]